MIFQVHRRDFAGILFMLFFTLILTGCREQLSSPASFVTPKVVEEIDLQIDTISFSTPSTVHELPFRIFSQSSSNPDRIYIGYNRRTHNIERFDFQNLKFGPITRLSHSGPDGITEISSIFYHNRDSIFLLELNPNRLWLMDGDENLDLIVDIKDQSEMDEAMKGLFAVNYNNSCPIYFKNQKIFFALRSYDNKDDFSIPVVGYYDLRAKKLGVLDVHYPESYQQYAYGFYDFANIAFSGDRIIVNFPISTAIYIYDLEGNLLKTVSAIPEIEATRPIDPKSHRSMEGRLEHLNGSPFLYPIQPLRNGEYFIQFGRSAVPEEIIRLGREAASEDAKSKVFGYNLIYNKDFDQVYLIRVNKIFFSNGGDYFYHQLPLESSEMQWLERYQLF